MIFLFYFLAVVEVFLSYKSWRGGVNYLNFFKRELAKPESNYTPFVSIIAPCRGLDENLEENLSPLFQQKFPAYEILFVVDNAKDEAVPIIQKILNRRDAETRSEENKMKKLTLAAESQLIDFSASPRIYGKILVAGEAENEGQKVHNLREAVLQVSEKSEVYVFVDSDARPNENWLRNLIAPLENEEIGCATGYRWFVSEKGNLASQLRSVWNASIASALGANLKGNFCWGGSMAMRRQTFEKIEMREYWRGVLSDDFAVTRRLKELNLPIYFVPQALTASVENCTWREFFEFTTRQMKITRVYAPVLWKASLIGSGIFNAVLIWGILNLIFNAFNSFAFWFSLISLSVVIIFSVGKSWLRLKAVRFILTNYQLELKQQFWAQNVLWIFTPAVFFYNSLSALLSRRIVWRGIGYELKSASETLIRRENTTKKRLLSSDG